MVAGAGARVMLYTTCPPSPRRLAVAREDADGAGGGGALEERGEDHATSDPQKSVFALSG
jgi:hypothetical protein